jgi:hypothetical protein
MNAKFTSRAVVTLALGILLGLSLHLRMETRRNPGKDVFLTEQGQRWERVYSRPHHLALGIFAGVVLSAAVFGVYELAAAGLCWTVKKVGCDQTKSSNFRIGTEG